MAPYHRNARKTWLPQDIKSLRKLVADGTPDNVIALKLGRSIPAIKQKRRDIA